MTVSVNQGPVFGRVLLLYVGAVRVHLRRGTYEDELWCDHHERTRPSDYDTTPSGTWRSAHETKRIRQTVQSM